MKTNLSNFKSLIVLTAVFTILSCAKSDNSASGTNNTTPTDSTTQTPDAQLKTQVEPRKITMSEADLLITRTGESGKINKMVKENLANETIEKTFVFENIKEDIALTINGYSQFNKADCVSQDVPVITATKVIDDGEAKSFELNLEKPLLFAIIKLASSLKLTIAISNPGQCKSLSYDFVVTNAK